jgi:excisionase family DNA binding protein
MNARRNKYQITEAAKRLGVSRTKLWKMIKNNEVASHPDPLDSRKKLIDEEDIKALLEQSGVLEERAA